jgi:1,2-phenylacetyl-CoA epoxidase catalytic subunit
VLLRSRILGSTPAEQRSSWLNAVRPTLEGCGLRVPSGGAREGGRHGIHTHAFDQMHAEMTEVWRSDPEARW